MTEQLPQDPSQPKPGWYADPGGDQTLRRWWDGRGWTAQTQPAAGSAPPLQPTGPGQQPGGVPSRHSADPWAVRHKALSAIIAVVALLLAAGIGSAASGGGKTAAKAAAAPTVTVTTTQTVSSAGPTVTATATATVQATANAQGEATQISSDGVYVVGQDIPGGTWHTSGGSQCYEATLSSTNTDDIIDNNNFSGPDTISLADAKAFDISGGCTWSHE